MAEWDSFTADVEKASGTNKGPDCTIGVFIASLGKLAKFQVEGALSRPELTSTSITRALRERGFKVSDFTVRRHRRGDCLCSKNG